MASSTTTSSPQQEQHDLSKDRAVGLCCSHLQGSWTSITNDNIDLSLIPGGLNHRVFLCHNKSFNDKVIIRLYGTEVQSVDDVLRNIGLVREVLIFQLMSENNIGPHLLGVFDGGRIEEYIDGSHVLSDDDIGDRETMSCLAKKLAKLHSIQVPINKNPKDYIGIIRENLEKCWKRYHDAMKNREVPENYPPESRQLINKAINGSYNMLQIIDYYQENLAAHKSRIVFSHGDVIRGNVLVDQTKSNGENKITLIDYELSGYNYRGVDIGHHFKSRTFGPTPFSKGKLGYPSEDERRFFIKSYLEELISQNGRSDDGNDTVHHILIEAELYYGVYHLFFISNMIRLNSASVDKMVNHPGIFMGRVINDFEERRERIQQLTID